MAAAASLRLLKSAALRLRSRPELVLIPLAAAVACLPRFVRGISCGHDFSFHFVFWLETQQSWRNGVLYPHWAQSPNWGAGEARFVFYPPLTWMLGAGLGYLFPWEQVPGLLTFLFLMGAGFATRALARQFLPAGAATLAGVLATSTPYALFTAYERTAFSELAAAVWIPLLLLFALRQSGSTHAAENRSRAFDGNATLLALVLAATWLTNAPAGVMGSYLLAFVAAVAAIILRAWWPVWRAGAGALLGLGLASVYLIPAAWEQRWIAVQQAVDVGMRISDSWLFARHGIPDLELHDRVLLVASLILVLTVALASAGLGMALLRRKLQLDTKVFWLPLALLLPVLLLLQFSFTAPIWNSLPKLAFLQFPWRWLVVLGMPFCTFLAAATPLDSRRAVHWSILVWAIVLVVSSSVATLFFFQECDEEDQVHSQFSLFQAGTGTEGTDEYAALGSDNTLVASGLPDACLVTDPMLELGEHDADTAPVWSEEQGSCDDVFTADIWQTERKFIHVDSDSAGYVVVRLRRYPAWLVTINGKPAPESLPQREDGLIVLPVAAGESSIKIQWATTTDELWGRGVSIASLALLGGLAWAEQRSRRLRLS